MSVFLRSGKKYVSGNSRTPAFTASLERLQLIMPSLQTKSCMNTLKHKDVPKPFLLSPLFDGIGTLKYPHLQQIFFFVC